MSDLEQRVIEALKYENGRAPTPLEIQRRLESVRKLQPVGIGASVQAPRDTAKFAIKVRKSSVKSILTPEELSLARAVALGDRDITDLPDLYDKLFLHYMDTEEMPYGIMKAKDGDPYDWITERLEDELGRIPCPDGCGGCSCHSNPPCSHCSEGHGLTRD